MKKLNLLSICFILAITGVLPATARAAGDTRYITDQLYVPLRSGKSLNHRILHKGLPSGTIVTLIETDEEAGYSLVRTDRGLEGWLPSHYLEKSPTAAIRLSVATDRVKDLEQENINLKKAFSNAAGSSKEAKQVIASLQTENERLKTELDEIKRISANAIKLDRDYKVLAEDKQVLKDKVDLLESETSRLRDNHENESFLYGVFAVILGMLLAVIIPRLKPKRRSEWV